MTLIELAERRRSERDPLLKMGTAILRLNERIAEEQDAIRDQSIFSMDEAGIPAVVGFRDGQIVERAQLQIAALTDSKSQL